MKFSLLMVRGEALVALGRFEEAAQACRRALSLMERDGPLTPESETDLRALFICATCSAWYASKEPSARRVHPLSALKRRHSCQGSPSASAPKRGRLVSFCGPTINRRRLSGAACLVSVRRNERGPCALQRVELQRPDCELEIPRRGHELAQ